MSGQAGEQPRGLQSSPGTSSLGCTVQNTLLLTCMFSMLHCYSENPPPNPHFGLAVSLKALIYRCTEVAQTSVDFYSVSTLRNDRHENNHKSLPKNLCLLFQNQCLLPVNFLFFINNLVFIKYDNYNLNFSGRKFSIL